MSDTRTISLIIVEDEVITRTGLRLLLDQVPDISVVGEAADGRVAVDKTVELRPNVVLMDIVLPGIDGIEATRRIKQAVAEVAVLMLSSFEHNDHVFASLAAGADGYCLKTISPEQLAVAIRAVGNGVAWLDPGIARRVLKAAVAQQPGSKVRAEGKFSLSKRELEVLELLVQGKTNQEIPTNWS